LATKSRKAELPVKRKLSAQVASMGLPLKAKHPGEWVVDFLVKHPALGF